MGRRGRLPSARTSAGAPQRQSLYLPRDQFVPFALPVLDIKRMNLCRINLAGLAITYDHAIGHETNIKFLVCDVLRLLPEFGRHFFSISPLPSLLMPIALHFRNVQRLLAVCYPIIETDVSEGVGFVPMGLYGDRSPFVAGATCWADLIHSRSCEDR